LRYRSLLTSGGKGKDHPRADQEGAEWEYRHCSNLSLTSALEGVVNATTRPLYPRVRPGKHCIRGYWAPGPIWTGAENLAPTGIQFPDRPARSESVYRLSYRGPQHIGGSIKRDRNVHFVGNEIKRLKS